MDIKHWRIKLNYAGKRNPRCPRVINPAIFYADSIVIILSWKLNQAVSKHEHSHTIIFVSFASLRSKIFFCWLNLSLAVISVHSSNANDGEKPFTDDSGVQLSYQQHRREHRSNRPPSTVPGLCCTKNFLKKIGSARQLCLLSTSVILWIWYKLCIGIPPLFWRTDTAVCAMNTPHLQHHHVTDSHILWLRDNSRGRAMVFGVISRAGASGVRIHS